MAPIRETRTALVRRARKVYRVLQDAYPDAHCELDFASPLQLLVATMLSAQCTDVRVNQVTPALFQAYPTAADFAGADRADLESLIESTGFFRTKAANIQATAAILCADYAGQVPADLEALVQLPSVGAPSKPARCRFRCRRCSRSMECRLARAPMKRFR